jgi:hypothetical protein
MEPVNSIFAIYAIAFLQLFFDAEICNNANAGTTQKMARNGNKILRISKAGR